MSEASNAKHDANEQPPASVAPVDETAAAFASAITGGLPLTAQVFFAVVEANGTLVRGVGAVSSARLGVGTYQVVFSQDVTGSAYLGTIGLTGNAGTSPAGQIAVVGRNGIPAGVYVQTFNATGAAADRSFHLSVLS